MTLCCSSNIVILEKLTMLHNNVGTFSHGKRILLALTPVYSQDCSIKNHIIINY